MLMWSWAVLEPLGVMALDRVPMSAAVLGWCSMKHHNSVIGLLMFNAKQQHRPYL